MLRLAASTTGTKRSSDSAIEQLIFLRVNDSEAAEWLSSYAYIEGLFQPKALRLKDELKRFVNEYNALDGIYKKRVDAALKPKLFIRAIILCDNAAILQHVKGIDFIELRAQMKAIDGRLFNDYMKLMQSKRS